GNDARWNAEVQLQIRQYGPDRTIGCDLLPTRYDRVAEALGGYGERVEDSGELRPAVERALASGLPSVLDVAVEAAAAPTF
ncbi:MAG: thiamine pyrophosphate-dependent enzyme, partial [Gemmatimonadetes bacterium]|nr:thiamine pyrophosphate-dependent enzyme [Gemmatimonadota bacterium]